MLLTKSVREVGFWKVIKGLGWAAFSYLMGNYVLPALLIGHQYKSGHTFYVSPESAGVFISIFYVILFLVVVLYLITGFRLLRYDGDWVVQVNSAGILWESPCEKVDISFSLSLAEIECIKVKSHGKGSDSYLCKGIVKKDDDGFFVSNIAGFDMNAICEELIRLGVPVRNE